MSFGNITHGAGGCAATIAPLKPLTQPGWKYGRDEARQGSNLCGKDVLPLGYSATDFIDIEEKTRQRYQMEDGWVYREELNPVLISTQLLLSPRQAELEQRRSRDGHEVADFIVIFVRNVVRNETGHTVSFRGSGFLAMGHLADGGPAHERLQSREALSTTKLKLHGRLGNRREIYLSFGPTMKCAEYTARNISAGCMYFAPADMGETSC